MNASYHVVELVRRKISNEHLTASDTDVARVLGISRALISAYKRDTIMSAQTLEKAQEILQLDKGELWEISTCLTLESSPQTKAVNAAHEWMRDQARRWGGTAVKGLALAMVAAGTIFAPAGNQASAASFNSSANIDYAPRRRRRARWARLFTVFPVAVLATACTQLRPLAEYQHLSHATQHFGDNRTNYGYDLASVGVRWRPAEAVTVDLLEGYSLQEMHGRREVFSGRVTVEFGGAR